jgi:hypothetical protein
MHHSSPYAQNGIICNFIFRWKAQIFVKMRQGHVSCLCCILKLLFGEEEWQKLQCTFTLAADLNKIWVICSYLSLFFRPLIQLHEEWILCYQGSRELGRGPGQIFFRGPYIKNFSGKIFFEQPPPWQLF